MMKDRFDSTFIELTHNEFIVFAEILHKINMKIEKEEHDEYEIMNSHVDFRFTTEHGDYKTFRDLVCKIHNINLKKAKESLEVENDPA